MDNESFREGIDMYGIPRKMLEKPVTGKNGYELIVQGLRPGPNGYTSVVR
jgi:hypothetical protein